MSRATLTVFLRRLAIVSLCFMYAVELTGQKSRIIDIAEIVLCLFLLFFLMADVSKEGKAK